jgi:hypothetical protein
VQKLATLVSLHDLDNGTARFSSYVSNSHWDSVYFWFQLSILLALNLYIEKSGKNNLFRYFSNTVGKPKTFGTQSDR